MSSDPASGNLTGTPLLPSDEYKIMVLLVDDQPMVGEAIRRALINEEHIDFHFCTRADEALAVAEKTRPTVILQDLVMPGVDGMTLVRQYRASPVLANVPIIVLSSRDDPEIKRDAFAGGANDYMVKLPDVIELVARLRYHSRSYINLLQRDAAYRALRESQQQLQKTNFELQRLTNTDGLTGIANRRYFDDYLGAEWRRARRDAVPLSLLLIDVDFFKRYNDNYGHVAGDTVLRRVAQIIDDTIQRPADLAARFGGEEFAMILPRTPIEGAHSLGQKLCQRIEANQVPHERSDISAWLTVSIGAACVIPGQEQDISELIEMADRRLYLAKQQGRNRVVWQDG
ncbi:diguanylate cyclase [Herbaspirillum rubrisubalbicans]|jgi:two-component system chemotaxis family response regulator WspR|uniref:diguanylate cyclase n=2 Tax=Herbaspirillum rubrisubalbicans TaxID=80842 RepID=A0ABX9C318_9BURK|nr:MULTISPECIES: diguanylate cyclase [Herbaspirillum]MCP1573374.1 two-component system chemotaxis family response regulator WspR [Herbaspirillum rubrisubalbicans]QJQ01870.1 diguanylate cyclase response regulator [Herbaspirillum rubrisubalbicans Os34]RAM64843.1 diguanylate cyclase [Herbaspirillum rubrisubalbicans]RAN48194.1 diguanylate cyclase [Herbaspirillum rubrisubalbicans]